MRLHFVGEAHTGSVRNETASWKAAGTHCITQTGSGAHPDCKKTAALRSCTIFRAIRRKGSLWRGQRGCFHLPGRGRRRKTGHAHRRRGIPEKCSPGRRLRRGRNRLPGECRLGCGRGTSRSSAEESARQSGLPLSPRPPPRNRFGGLFVGHGLRLQDGCRQSREQQHCSQGDFLHRQHAENLVGERRPVPLSISGSTGTFYNGQILQSR